VSYGVTCRAASFSVMLFVVPHAALAIAPSPTHGVAVQAQVSVSPKEVQVVAGQTSPPVSVKVTGATENSPPAFTFLVQLPAELAGQVAAQPAGISIAVAPGSDGGESQLRFVAGLGAPAGSWDVALRTADGSLTARLTLETRTAPSRGGEDRETDPRPDRERERDPPPDPAPDPAREPAADPAREPARDPARDPAREPPPDRLPPGRVPGADPAVGRPQVTLLPARLEVCEGGEPARGTVLLAAKAGFRGNLQLKWDTPPAGMFATAQMGGLNTGFPDVDLPPTPLPAPRPPGPGAVVVVPPDRNIPFEVAARGAEPGSHSLTLVVVDAARGLTVEASTRIVVRTADFRPSATPASLTVRQDGPPARLAIAIERDACLGRRSVRVTATEVPAGLELTPPTAELAAPGAQAGFHLRAMPDAQAGSHVLRFELVDVEADPSSATRRELEVPVSVEELGPAELVRAPRIDRVEPARLAPGQRATLELTGDNLGPEVGIAFAPDDITIVAPPIFHSRTRATVEVEVRSDTRVGPRLVVTTGRLGTFEGPARLRIELDRLAADRVEAEGEPDAEPAAEEPQEDPPADPPEEPGPAEPPADVARLDFGGFVVEVATVSTPDLDAFAGEGTLEEFVFAGRLQTVPLGFAFENLSLEATGTAGLFDVVAGEALRDQAVNLSLPLELAGMGVQLHRMVLSPGGALIDGKVFLPFFEGGPATGVAFGPNAGGAGGAGGDGAGEPLSDGFGVIPAYDSGGGGAGLPVHGGGEVLTYHSVPVTGGALSNALLEQVAAGEAGGAGGAGGGVGGAPGFNLQVEPGAPDNSLLFSDQPLDPNGDFIVHGLARVDAYAIGETGVAFQAQSGLSVLVDLSRGENQNQPAIDYAYRAWDVPEDAEEEAAGLGIGMNYAGVVEVPPPAVPHDSPLWMGLVFFDAQLSANAIGVPNATTDLAWVANGFQALFAKALGGTTEMVTAHGWEVELLNAALGIKNSVLIDAGALGNVHLPFFDESIRVLLKMTNGGSPHMEAIAPVAHLFGHTAVIGEGAGFFWDGGQLKLGFTDAQWAFNGNLDNPQPPSNPGGIDGALVSNQGAQTTIEFLNSSYARKFHLKYLTLEADGDAHLYGATRRSLSSVPSLDFLDYPFLDGGAWILLEQQSGSTWVLGLEGNLELAANLGGVSAVTRYTVSNGTEGDWTFEGSIDADVNVVHFGLDVDGEVDLATKDVFFNATGQLTVEQLFGVDAAGAFGRQGSTRYWYVFAALDLQGVPIFDTGFVSFFAFKGGVAHNLELGQSGPCSALEPVAFAQNADQCVDGGVDWTFLAGTVLAPSQAYGGAETVHVDGTLVISSQGSVDILGQAWMLRTFAQGYGGGATAQAAAHIGVDAERFVMTACVGPSGSSQGAPASAQTISCEGLEPLKYPKAAPVVEIRGWTGLLVDWTNNTYYLALGNYGNRVEAKFFGLSWQQGYMVLAYSPSVPASWLPPLAGGSAGFYAGRGSGYDWGFEYNWGKICNNSVWAYASLGSESNFFLEFVPFALYADVHYWVNVGVGAQICGIGGGVKVAGDVDASVYVSQALGELSGGFSGDVMVCGPNNCLKLIHIPNININLTLWQS